MRMELIYDSDEKVRQAEWIIRLYLTLEPNAESDSPADSNAPAESDAPVDSNAPAESSLHTESNAERPATESRKSV